MGESENVLTDKIGIIIPAYNEPRLPRVLERLDYSTGAHVLVVDDGTDDGSIESARGYPVTILRHNRRQGVGAALRTGLRFLRQNGFSIAVIIAGNNKDDPAEIPRLIAAINNGADYVQGSRFLEKSLTRGTPWRRRLISRMAALVWSLRFARALTEITNGFRAYRIQILDDPRINLEQAWLDRYELEYYLHYKVLSLGYRYVEIPVRKQYPNDGLSTSKIKLHRDLWSLVRPIVLLSLRLAK